MMNDNDANIEVVSNWRKSVQLPKSVCNFNLEKLRRKEKKVRERIELLEEEIAVQTRKTKIKPQTINLNPETLIICRKLSNSINHSEVFAVKIDGWKCAMKKTKKYANQNDIDCFVSEVEIHSKILPHPNVIQYLFHQYINEELCLFMTLKSCTLKDAIIQKMRNNQTFTSKEIAHILIGCAKGLSHLNDENQIIHRDVKSENVFVDIGLSGEIADVTIADFDTAIQINESERVTGVIGTRGFIAPEVLTCEEVHEYNYKVDVYSFGMMCYELMTFTTPFENIQNQNEHFRRIISGDTPMITKDKIKLYAPLVALHLSCVSLSPASRPSWSEIISILEVIKDPPVI